MDLTLYFTPMACSRVPMIALEEIGVTYAARPVALMKGENREPEYLAKNPAGKVPLLVADGISITQNPAIQIFLAQRFPDAKLLPLSGDINHDIGIYSRLMWFSADIHQIVTRICMPHIACDAATDRVREQATALMYKQMSPLEEILARQPHVFGDDWSTADAYLFWVWSRITGSGFDQSAFPALAAHHARTSERPSVQRMLAREAQEMQAAEVD